YFHPKLVKLPHTSLLWTLVAVHFCTVIPFCRLDSSTIHFMFDISSHYRSCTLRSLCNGSSISLLECIRFFLDKNSRISYTTLKYFSMLKERCSYFFIVITLAQRF